MSHPFRTALKYAAKAAFLYSGLVSVRNAMAAARGRSPVTVLAYHRVADDPADVNAVTPEIFDRQMAFLRRKCRVIGVGELLEILRSGENRKRAVVITFDDGYRDNLTNAAPILRKYGLPACFFLSTGFIGTGRPLPHDLRRLGAGVATLSWDEARELRRQGFEIGSHTVNHARLSHCTPEELRLELSESRATLEQELGEEVTLFSFPFGKPGDCSREVMAEIRMAGYACNFSAHGGLAEPGDDLYDIQRQGVSNHPSLLFFHAWVEGWRIGSY